MAAIIPSDTHVVGDPGHTVDHDNMADVLGLLAEGLSNRAIGQRLFIAERTVEVHIGHLFMKLGIAEDDLANRRVLAALTYLRNV